MKQQDRKYRRALSLLFAAVIFIFMIITTILSFIVAYLLIKAKIISVKIGMEISPAKTLFLMSVISTVLGGVFAAFASKYPLKPINNMISRMNRLAAGDFKARLKFPRLLEEYTIFKDISESFNTMARELESTEVLRSDFINNFSHEFKTPVVSISGFAKLLKKGNLTEEQKLEYINIIEEESMRLSDMVTNVLTLTKYENQVILTDVKKFNLSEQIRSSILTLEGKWMKKDIDFNLNFDEYNISGNKDMLKLVWINLIDNAIKFSPDRGVVDIDITEKDSIMEISVSNNGEDIPQDKIKYIFHKFYQADESHGADGNGIGLALVKGIVELHNGKVSVVSDSGKTTFTVALPKEQNL